MISATRVPELLAESLDLGHVRQWAAFTENLGAEATLGLGVVIDEVSEFVLPPAIAAATEQGDPLELSLQLKKTPMSAVGSKSNYGFPDAVARDLLMSWENQVR